MIELLILSVGMSAFSAVVCTAIYARMKRTAHQISEHQRNLDRIEARLNDQMVMHDFIKNRLDQLATDVLQREIYQNANDRHQLAIKDAKRGLSHTELIQYHGLSSDEASLILSLHTSDAPQASRAIEAANANLRKVATAGDV